MAQTNLPLPYTPTQIADPLVAANFNEIQRQWPATAVSINVVGAAGQPAFAGAWVNFGAPLHFAAFWKVGDRVFLRGTVKAGVIGTPIFTLPAGLRPSATVGFACASGLAGVVAIGTAQVSAAGVVTAATGNNTDFALDGIQFTIV